MKLFVENSHGTLWFCLNIIRWVGFLVPDELTGIKKKIYPLYALFWFVFIGIYVITQTGCLIQVWGQLGEMTNASFLLFTNLAFTVKIFNVMLRRRAIQAIIEDGDRVLRNETKIKGRAIVDSASFDNRKLIYLYAFVTMVTVFGWAIGAEKNQLPLRAWYPYDTSKSPAYEITYAHQEVNNSVLRIISMTTYLMCMIIQVFIYCYQGNHLAVECYEVSDAIYECPWYLCSVPLRRALLMMMIRSKKVIQLTAGGFTTLSLESFMSIIKASYSFFTVLQQMEQRDYLKLLLFKKYV